MEQGCDLGVFGLATMGANLARNAARRGFSVAVYNRHAERTDTLIERFGHEGKLVPSRTVEAFVASLRRPRSIVIMVEAGAAIDAIMDQLRPLLEHGDILVDAGNSLFSDTDRRVGWAAARGLRFLGMGVSGGEEGALEGPSMMPGGDRGAYRHLAPLLTRMAAQVEGKACCAYMGPGGAGHYVKMVHNGIEYADIQAIAETYDLLRSSYGLAAPAIADVLEGWRDGELSSYLLDVAVEVLRRQDGDAGYLVDKVLDEAAQTGTGQWTAADALRLGVVATSTGAAVDARTLSAASDLRRRAAPLLGAARPGGRALDAAAAQDLEAALLASRIVAFSQGFDLLAEASVTNGWAIDPETVASIWRGGCIIRARLLDRILESPGEMASDEPFILRDWARASIARSHAGWRRVIAVAVEDGVPAPVMSSAISYFDGLRRHVSAANLIQAMRDEFGAHGYRRADSGDEQHSDWRMTGTDAQ